MIVMIHFAWLSAGAIPSRVLRDPASSRPINLLLAAALAATTLVALPG
ncbi:MAG: hypothetical protein ACLQE9_23040 [Roseiarcus sp.]